MYLCTVCMYVCSIYACSSMQYIYIYACGMLYVVCTFVCNTYVCNIVVYSTFDCNMSMLYEYLYVCLYICI